MWMNGVLFFIQDISVHFFLNNNIIYFEVLVRKRAPGTMEGFIPGPEIVKKKSAKLHDDLIIRKKIFRSAK